MNEMCKHFHIDGAMHEPCYQCKCEVLQEEIRNLNNEIDEYKHMLSDQRQILSWCGSLEEAKLNGEFEIKDGVDSWFLRNVKTICQLATIDIKG